MKDSNEVVQLNDVLYVIVKLLALLLLLFMSLRVPVVWIKIPMAAALVYFAWRWFFRAKKKNEPANSPDRTESSSLRKARIERLEAAVSRSSKPGQNVVRLLVAYDAAGEFGQAKKLIKSMDSKEFPEYLAEEFAVLARNYFPLLERIKNIL